MAIISSFLCWSNTRTGSAVCGYYTLVISVVCLAFYMLRYIALDEIDDSIELKGIVYAGFVLYSFLIGVSLILLPGVYMDRKFLLLPWIYVLVITVLYETGAIALITTVHLEQDQTLDAWEIVAVAFYCLRLLANCYSFACVVSQYQELSEGRGTYEFLYKPHRRHHMGRMTRGGSLFDVEEYNPPYGASLPPYSAVNPYKEYSPPNYENLALNYEDIDAVVTSPSRRSRSRCSDSPGSLHVADVVVNAPPRGLEDQERSVASPNPSSRSSDTGDCGQSSSTEGLDMPLPSSHSIIPGDFTSPRHHHRSHRHPHHRHHHRHHHHHHRHHSDLKEISHQSQEPIAMTSSSARTLDDSQHITGAPKSVKGNGRPKRITISPLSIQKRTYITWI